MPARDWSRVLVRARCETCSWAMHSTAARQPPWVVRAARAHRDRWNHAVEIEWTKLATYRADPGRPVRPWPRQYQDASRRQRDRPAYAGSGRPRGV